jgi:hypothetical protein
LKLLFCAFIGLAVVAYLFAETAASDSCLQTSAQETLSGGILGSFAIVMLVALTWLLAAFSLQAHGVLKFLRGLIWFASAFVVFLLCTSSYDYLVAALPGGPPELMLILTYVVGVISLLAAVPAYMWTRVFAWVASHLVRPGDGPRLETESVTFRDGAVDLCAKITIGYLAVAGLSDAVALSASDWWNHPRPTISYIVAWASLLLPLVVLVMALRALAPDSDSGGAVDKNQKIDIQQAIAQKGDKHAAGLNKSTATVNAKETLLQPPLSKSHRGRNNA